MKHEDALDLVRSMTELGLGVTMLSWVSQEEITGLGSPKPGAEVDWGVEVSLYHADHGRIRGALDVLEAKDLTAALEDDRLTVN